MADDQKDNTFPDISNKLSAPTKKTHYEKQKAEAEAKRLREEKETAAALHEFTKDFGGPSDDEAPSMRGSVAGRGRGGGLGSRMGFDELDAIASGLGGLGGKRHHVPKTGQARSGPGSLGPASAFGTKKRSLGDLQQDTPRGPPRPEQSVSGADNVRAVFQSQLDEEDPDVSTQALEREAPKPTIRLSNLPPQMSESEVKALLPESLHVETIRTEQVGGGKPTQRPCKAMIATLPSNTPNKDIEKAIADIRDTYLGWGFNLVISKHLPTNALGSVTAHAPLSTIPPFGAIAKAKPPPPTREGPRYQNQPPPPEEAFSRGQYGRQQEAPAPLEVQVVVPSDFKEVLLINKTLEQILKHGPEFEASLQTLPDIQRDECWSWFWNPHSVGGVYFRWQLSNLLRQIDIDDESDEELAVESKGPIHLFEDSEAWCPPENDLVFMSPTQFEELIDDSAYNETLDEEDEETKKTTTESNTVSFLNPLQKARLIHLLFHLPTATGKLSKGDIARITAFAINNAAGAPEIVDIIVSNILQPLNLTKISRDSDGEAQYTGINTDIDPSGPKQIGLYVVNDILFASSSTAVRHCWRYRDLLGAALKDRRVFDSLGCLGKDLNWGVMRLDKWKRTITNILELWKSKSVFPPETQQYFAAAFELVTEKIKNDMKAANKPDGVAPASELDQNALAGDMSDAPPSDTMYEEYDEEDEDDAEEEEDEAGYEPPPPPNPEKAARAERLAEMRASLAALEEAEPAEPPSDQRMDVDTNSSQVPSSQQVPLQARATAPKTAFSMSLSAKPKTAGAAESTGAKPAMKMSLGLKQTADEVAGQERERAEQKEHEAQTKRGRPRAADLF